MALEDRRLLSGETTLQLDYSAGVNIAVIDLPAGAISFTGISTDATGGVAFQSPINASQVVYQSGGLTNTDTFAFSYNNAAGQTQTYGVTVQMAGVMIPPVIPLPPVVPPPPVVPGMGMINVPPIADDYWGTTPKDTHNWGIVTAFDVNGDVLIYSSSAPEISSSAPEITFGPNGRFIYECPVGVVGLQTYSYSVSDGHNPAVTRALKIMITKPTVSINSRKDFYELSTGNPNTATLGKGEFSLFRTAGNRSPLTVTLTYTGSATNGVDFVGSTTVTFAAGESMAILAVQSATDQTVETVETVDANINESNDYDRTHITQATISLFDNDGWKWKTPDPADAHGSNSTTTSAPNSNPTLNNGVVTASLNWDVPLPGKVTASMGGTSMMPKVRLVWGWVASLVSPGLVYTSFWEPYIEYQNIMGSLDYQFSFDPVTGNVIPPNGSGSGATNSGNLSGGLGGKWTTSGRSATVVLEAVATVTSTVTSGGSVNVAGGGAGNGGTLTGGITLTLSTTNPDISTAVTYKTITLVVEQYEW